MSIKKGRWAIGWMSAALAMSAMAAGSDSWFSKPEAAVKYRQSVFQVMSQHMTHLGSMVSGKRPMSMSEAAVDASMIEAMAPHIAKGFIMESKGLPSKSRPEVWEEMSKFKDMAGKLEKEAKALSQAVKMEDVSKMKEAFAATSKSCKGCHDAYKD